MTRNTTLSLMTLAAEMQRVSGGAFDSGFLAYNLTTLSGFAKSLYALAHVMCDKGLNERQENQVAKMEQVVEKMQKRINLNMGDDPALHFIIEMQHGDPRYPMVKIWHNIFPSDRTPGKDGIMRGCETVLF